MKRWRNLFVSLAGTAAMAGAGAGSAMAQPAECAPCREDRVVQDLPADYGAVLVVNEASRQLKSRPGRALAAALVASGAMPETMRAWGGLASTLGWTRERAFDELLGRKFTVVMRGLDRPEGPDWALLTEVSPEAELRLRSRLEAAPRGNIAGLAVLSVEDGGYELVVGRGGGNVNPDHIPTATVLLGPGGVNPLFTELAPSLLTRTGLASPLRSWRAGERDRECDLVVLLRPGGGRELAVRAAMDASGWQANVVCSRGLLIAAPGAAGTARPWSDAPFLALERDAIVAIMGPGGGALVDDGGLLVRLAGIPRILASWFSALPSDRLGALFVHPARASGERARASAKPTETGMAILLADPRAVRPVRTDPPPDVALLGQWCLTLALESGEEGVGRGGDASGLAARLLAAIQNGELPAGAPGAEIEQVDGRFHGVVLDESFPIHQDLLPRLTRLSGEEPLLSWGVRPSGAAATGKAGRAAERSRGWSVISISPGAVPMAERDAGALAAAAGGGTSKARLSLGMVRPEALASVLGREDSILPAWARGVESVRWDAWLRADGMIEATVGLKMAR